MNFDQAVQAAAGLLATGIGGWMVKSLVDITRLIAVVQSELKAHDDRLDEHDEKHRWHDERNIGLDRRVSHIEGRSLPRQG